MNSKPRFQKMISLLLCAVLIAGIFPVGALTGLAEQQIASVDVYGFETPAYNAAPQSPSDLYVHSTEPYTIHPYANRGLTWYNAQTNAEYTGSVFTGGRYYARIILKAKSGYTFGAEGAVSDSIGRIAIKGLTSFVDRANSRVDMSGERLVITTVIFTVPSANLVPITDVSVNGFVEPSPGNAQPAVSRLTVPGGAHYSVVSYTWKNFGRVLESGAKFVNNTEYTALIELKPDSGYYFPGSEYASVYAYDVYSGDRYSIDIDGDDWKVDLISSVVFGDSGNLLIETKPIYATNTMTYITSIAISGFDIPYVEMELPGGAPQVADDAPYVIADYLWFDNDLYCDAGEPYGIEMTVDALRGCCFKWGGDNVEEQFDSFTVNGTPFFAGSVSMEGPTRAHVTTKSVIPNYTVQIDFEEDPVLIQGQSAAENPPAPSIRGNAFCTIIDSCWYDAATNSVFTGVFQRNHSYYPHYVIRGEHKSTDLPEHEGEYTFLWEYLNDPVYVTFPDGSSQIVSLNENEELVLNGPRLAPYGIFSGSVGSCRWTYDEYTRTFTVSGSGTFELNDEPAQYLYDAKIFIVEEGVTGIGDNVLLCSGTIEKVVLADSVQTVGIDCFQTCDRLTDLTLSAGLVSVGGGSFSELPITSLSLPASLRTVGAYAFSYLTRLTSLTIAYGLQTVGEGAFSGCTILPEVTVPRSVTSIGARSFGYDPDEEEIIFSFEINGYTFSAAHYYAVEYGFLFNALDDPGDKYYVVGEGYPFAGWTAQPGFDLTKDGDGIYKRNFFSSEEGYEQAIKILMIDAETLAETLIGKDGTDACVCFEVLRTGWFTVNYDPDTGRIWLEGETVNEFEPAPHSRLYAVGTGAGTFLNGAVWDVGCAANRMTLIRDGVWFISCRDVLPGNYEMKFVFDGSWDGDNFGAKEDAAVGYGVSGNAVVNGRNIGFKVRVKSTVSIFFDMTNYNEQTNTGAVYYITVTELEQPGDVNGDGTIAIDDASDLLDRLADGSAYADPALDVNGDGFIDIDDVSALLDILSNNE